MKNIKNIKLFFNWKCLILFIFDLIPYIGLIVTMVCYGDEKYGWLFSYVDIYLLFVFYPLVFIHGVISYLLTKEIIRPHIVYFAAVLIIDVISLTLLSYPILSLGLVSIIISLFVSSLLLGIVKLFKLMLKPDPKYME